MDVTVTDPLTGRVLGGRYRVGERIARGGMATVYRAVDDRLGRPVALKVMHAGLCEDAGFVRRFVREARSVAQLSHPNVVAVFDQGQDGDVVYLAMEHVEGVTLRRLLAAQGPLPPVRALQVLERILAALSAAHEAGLIHRDVKPENVLLGPDGAPDSVKVADFGLARAVTAATSSTATQGQLIGTVSYLAPEQVLHGRADARSDVYAAGLVLYEMLTGRKARDGDSPIQVAYQHVHADVAPPSERAAAVTEPVDTLVLRATARDPAVRPADAGSFLRHVRRTAAAVANGSAAPPVPVDPGGPQHTQHTRHTALDTGELPATPDPPAGPDAPDAAAAARTRRRRGPLVALLVLALLGGLAVPAWYLGVYRYTRVPQLVGLSRAAADRAAADAHLRLRVAGRTYSEVVRRGHLVRVAPAAADRVRRDSTVSGWLSRGPERHPMPDLSGRTEAAARRLVHRARLRVAEVDGAYSGRVPRGRVVSFSPDAGTSLRPGSRVSLVLSRGPAPVRIPDVTGRDAREVTADLRRRGLRVDSTEEYSVSVPEGDVVSQRPGPGTGHRGDRIRLVVSKGPRLVAVPTVRGHGEAEARQELAAAGFRVEVRRSEVYVGLHVVVRQTPQEGTSAPQGSTVVLEIV